MDHVIEVNNLNFGYDGKLVLRDISFSIIRGDYLGIIGTNGSGKSTLLKLILKILPLSEGEIKILGINISNFTLWNKVGYISQNATAFNGSFPASVEEIVGANLFSKIGLFKMPQKKHKTLVYEALEKVGMQDSGKKMIGNLSGGQQQRVFIARVLVSDPELLLLDEPTAGIDAKSEDAVYCLLADLNKNLGLTVVMVTHDIAAVTIHANRFICLGENGFFEHTPNDENADRLLTEIYGHGVHLHHDCKNCIKD
jgi:zinc transport system ATP-binding protein